MVENGGIIVPDAAPWDEGKLRVTVSTHGGVHPLPDRSARHLAIRALRRSATASGSTVRRAWGPRSASGATRSEGSRVGLAFSAIEAEHGN